MTKMLDQISPHEAAAAIAQLIGSTHFC